MEKLQTLLNLLTSERRVHISVLDVSGILNLPICELEFGSVIHSKNFCNIAKSTDEGFRACLECKGKANKKASDTREAFSGHCVFGLYEAAVPVIIDGNTAAVVYVGNAILDEKRTRNKLIHTASATGADCAALLRELEFCERIEDKGELFALGNIVADYIKLITRGEAKSAGEVHWLVKAMKRHAEEENPTPSLKSLALIYNRNEKYMGRLFLKEVGMSFRSYAIKRRINRAAEIISSRDGRIIDAALDCGFDNISYFNRAFQREFGVSPSEYRLMHGKKAPSGN